MDLTWQPGSMHEGRTPAGWSCRLASCCMWGPARQGRRHFVPPGGCVTLKHMSEAWWHQQALLRLWWALSALAPSPVPGLQLRGHCVHNAWPCCWTWPSFAGGRGGEKHALLMVNKAKGNFHQVLQWIHLLLESPLGKEVVKARSCRVPWWVAVAWRPCSWDRASVPAGCLPFAPSHGGGTPGPLHKQFCKGLSKATGFRENLKKVPVLITLAKCLKSGGLISALFVLKSLGRPVVGLSLSGRAHVSICVLWLRSHS